MLSICQILNDSPDQHNNLKICKDYCTLLRISSNSNDLLFDSERITQIKECSDFTQLFGIVSLHMSWDEHPILTHIVDECRSIKGQQEIEKFENKLALLQGLQLVASDSSAETSSKEFARFYIIVNRPYKQVTMEDYKEIKAYIFSHLNVYAYVAVGFIRLLCHSLHIEWLITIQAVSHMTKVARKNQDFFIKNGYVFIQIANEVVISEKVSTCLF